jgi:hypothetical protein
MKTAVFSLLVLILAIPVTGAVAGEPPVSVTIRTRNWQGYAYETSLSEDGRFVKKFRKDGGPDMKEAPVVAEGSLTPDNLEHLSKIVEHSGFFSLKDDMVLQDLSPDAVKDRLEGQLTISRAGLSKTVRFGPNVESIPPGVFEVLTEVSRLVQERQR